MVNKLVVAIIADVYHYIPILRTNTITRIEGGGSIGSMILLQGKEQHCGYQMCHYDQLHTWQVIHTHL